MARKRKKFKVAIRHLGQEQAFAMNWPGERFIEIDPRVKPKFFCANIIHECLHEIFPEASESKIDKAGTAIADALFHCGFKRVYDDNKLMKPRPKSKRKAT